MMPPREMTLSITIFLFSSLLATSGDDKLDFIFHFPKMPIQSRRLATPLYAAEQIFPQQSIQYFKFDFPFI